MRVLAVGELEHLLERAHHQRREVGALLLEPARDRGVVAGRVGERLRGEALARRRRQPAVELAQLGQDRVVALGADHRRRRTGSSWPPPGSSTDRRCRCSRSPRGRPRRGGRRSARTGTGSRTPGRRTRRRGPRRPAHVRGVVAQRQQPGVELRVERLDPAVHDLGETGQIGDRAHLDPGLRQLAEPSRRSRRSRSPARPGPARTRRCPSCRTPTAAPERPARPRRRCGARPIRARCALLHDASTLSLDHDTARIRGIERRRRLARSAGPPRAAARARSDAARSSTASASRTSGSSIARWKITGPVSTPSSTKCTVTPNTFTP